LFDPQCGDRTYPRRSFRARDERLRNLRHFDHEVALGVHSKYLRGGLLAEAVALTSLKVEADACRHDVPSVDFGNY
jgi:hypothetical protein